MKRWWAMLGLVACDPEILVEINPGPEPEPGAVIVSIHGNEVRGGDTPLCALKADGAVVCWHTSGPVDSPDARFSQIDVGRDTVCGVDLEGAVHCWGVGPCPGSAHCDRWGPDAPYVVQLPGPYVHVSVSGDTVCAINAAGQPTCTDPFNHQGRAQPPRAPFSSIELGTFHGCGLAQGQVQCWGLARFGVADPPPLDFVALFGPGAHYLCGLTAGGEAGCWGGGRANGRVVLVEQPPQVEFVDLALAEFAACGLVPGGTPVCWRPNRSGQLQFEWSEGPYADLALVKRGGCGLLLDGTVECYGDWAHTTPVPCQPGAVEPCFTGRAGAADVGECRTGERTCRGDHWSACEGEVLPSQDVCDGLDNACTGVADALHEVGQPCDPPGTCSPGLRECTADGGSTCDTGPGGSRDESGPELCDALDNDCDGAVDEDCQGLCDPAVENCCALPGSDWVRPGGFWDPLAGSSPQSRPRLEISCSDDRVDRCGRLVSQSGPCSDCDPFDCAPCLGDLNECRLSARFEYDPFGNLSSEFTQEQRHLDWFEFTEIRHIYDGSGLRVGTWGESNRGEIGLYAAHIRYINDAQGRLVREEAMVGVGLLDVPYPADPWLPTRVSEFDYTPDGIIERLDEDGDGEFEQMIPVGE